MDWPLAVVLAIIVIGALLLWVRRESEVTEQDRRDAE